MLRLDFRAINFSDFIISTISSMTLSDTRWHCHVYIHLKTYFVFPSFFLSTRSGNKITEKKYMRCNMIKTNYDSRLNL